MNQKWSTNILFGIKMKLFKWALRLKMIYQATYYIQKIDKSS